LFEIRFKWIRENLSPDSRIFINIRDFSDCMATRPRRCLKLITFLASFRPQIFGICFEEGGKYFPEQMGVWTKAAKTEIDRCQFTGKFLVHVHQQWGIMESIALECLANGANGVWAGICEEGASMGHASSCVTMMNLIRMGNKKVLKSFNCQNIRNAAIEVTKITTGSEPHSKQPIYGARALDHVFGLPQFDIKEATGFSLTGFLGVEPVMRISSLADPAMIVSRMTTLFGKDDAFTVEIGQKMKELMLEDLRHNRKEEYHSNVGLAMLFDRAGGKLSPAIRDVIEKDQSGSLHIKNLISEIRKRWDKWDLREGVIDNMLDFNAFYNGFMAPYFGCYRCDETKRALKCIDMDADGQVDWAEFALYLKWAGRQYPDVKTADDLLDIAFRKGIVSAMQDELVNEVKPLFKNDAIKEIGKNFEGLPEDYDDDDFEDDDEQ
jgi:hypothetical protein